MQPGLEMTCKQRRMDSTVESRARMREITMHSYTDSGSHTVICKHEDVSSDPQRTHEMGHVPLIATLRR